MKIFFQACCLVIGCLSAVTGDCAESYRAHFEVSVEDGTGKKAVNTPSDVVSGVPLTFEIGEKSLSLVFTVEPPPSDRYSLTVSLSPKTVSANALTTNFLTQTLHSRLVGGQTGPLEFEMEQDGISISGVVALSSIR